MYYKNKKKCGSILCYFTKQGTEHATKVNGDDACLGWVLSLPNESGGNTNTSNCGKLERGKTMGMKSLYKDIKLGREGETDWLTFMSLGAFQR